MRRLVNYYLEDWKSNPRRKSLLLRGARQVGKTHAARQLGASYQSFVEVNLERISFSKVVRCNEEPAPYPAPGSERD